MFVADTLRIRYKVQEDTNNHRPRTDPWVAKNVLITTPIRSCHAQYRRARPVSTFVRGWCRFSYVGRPASRRLNLIILVSSSVRGSASCYHVSYSSGRCVSNSSEKARYLTSYLTYLTWSPAVMLLQVYSFLVLIYDTFCLAFMVIKASTESFYHVFFPPRQKSVAGEIVLIAGAGRGVGRELAIQFSMLGATVICWDIQSDNNEETAMIADLLGYGVGKAYAYTCDVTNRDQVIKVADRIVKEVGSATVVINCCNLPSPRVLTESPAPDVRKTLDVGVMSHFWILQAFLPSMQRRRHGHIVMLTSVAGLTGINNLVPLSTAQFAVQGLAESLIEELRNYKTSGDVKLTLVHIYPFIVDKEMSTNIQLRIPSYFGTIEPAAAAREIIRAMRQDYMEVSIPRYLLYVGRVVSLLPRKAIIAMRELIDTGVDFG